MCQGSAVGQEGICSVFDLLVSEQCIMSTRVSRKLWRSSSSLVQATLAVGSVNFWSFTVAWTRGGGVKWPKAFWYLCAGKGVEASVALLHFDQGPRRTNKAWKPS